MSSQNRKQNNRNENMKPIDNMKKKSLVLLLAIATSLATAHSLSPIVGVVMDQSDKMPLPSVAIRLLHSADSILAKGTMTDEQGRFSIIPPKYGRYILQFDMLGYKTHYRAATVSLSEKISLDTVYLQPISTTLKEAVVVARVAEMLVKGDTVIYNADAYKTPESAMVEDLLKKIPGVEIDTEGAITVNGKQVKNILVDGEDFFTNDPKVATKNLPATMVEKLQVFDQKSDMAQLTGFDDGNEETVINLQIRPNMKKGLFGNALAGYGSKERYEGNLMVNYMKNKNQYTLIAGANNTNNAGFTDLSTALFGDMGGQGRRMRPTQKQAGINDAQNYGFNFNTTLNPKIKIGGNVRLGYLKKQLLTDEFTQNLLKMGDTFEKENTTTDSKSQNINIDMSATYTPDRYTTVIFSPNMSYNTDERKEWGAFETHDSQEQLLNSGTNSYTSIGAGQQLGGQIDMSRKIGDRGRVLSLQLLARTTQTNNRGINQSSVHYIQQADDKIDQHFDNNNYQNQYRAYLSYVEPITTNRFLQLSYRYTYNKVLNRKNTETKDEKDAYTILDKAYSRWLDNYFNSQDISLKYKTVGEKYDYTIGISIQPTQSYNKAYIGDSILSELSLPITNYAPTAQFNYRWDKRHNLKIDYEGTTKSPTSLQLTPVIDRTDPLNITYGNPALLPAFEHRLRLKYQQYDVQSKRLFLTFVNAAYLFDGIVPSIYTNAKTGLRSTTYQNLTGNQQLNIRTILNVPITSTKITFSSMSYAAYTIDKGLSNDEQFYNRQIRLYERLGLRYNTDRIETQIRGGISYNNTYNSLYNNQIKQYVNWNIELSSQIELPYDILLQTSIQHNKNAGYTTDYSQHEWLWDIALQKQIFKQKNATIRLKIYDILQQKNNINRQVADNYVKDITTNSLTNYFMLHFVYRFQDFKGGASLKDVPFEKRKHPKRD